MHSDKTSINQCIVVVWKVGLKNLYILNLTCLKYSLCETEKYWKVFFSVVHMDTYVYFCYNINNSHLLSACYMLDTHKHLKIILQIFMMTLKKKCYTFPLLIYLETEGERLIKLWIVCTLHHLFIHLTNVIKRSFMLGIVMGIRNKLVNNRTGFLLLECLNSWKKCKQEIKNTK